MRAFAPLLVLLALAGCTQAAEDPAALMAEVKRRLLRREARLDGYQLAGRVQDAGAPPVDFTFALRAPQRMRGTLLAPVSRVFAWDGKRFYVQDDARRQLAIFEDSAELPRDKRGGFLMETFTPFTPEGFRVPLLLSTTQARRASHARAPQAVELSVQVKDASGGPLEMTYVLRWPTLDFLGKRTLSADGASAEVRVEDEHCEEALGLCVPRRLSRWAQGQQVGTVELSEVRLGATLPNDAFSLAAPEGYEVKTRPLAEVASK